MAELSDDQWAAEVADIVAEMVAETITEAEAATRLAAATRNWPTRTLSNADLAARVSRFLARLNGLIAMEGPPDANVGELNAYYFDTTSGDFYGPKKASGWGDSSFSLVGPQGVPGPTGAKGDKGDTGSKGDTGDTGPQGGKGDKGETGSTGSKGDKGDQGIQGPQGLKGDRGEAFKVDAQGTLSGRSAHDGEPVGFSYLDDVNGNLYFRVAAGGWGPAIVFGKGEKGDKGDPGIAGPKGDTGAKGDTGLKGDTGSTGIAGAKGDKGEAGVTGAPGSDATVAFATVAEVLAGTAADKAIPPKALIDADLGKAVAASGAFALNGNDGKNFVVTLSANSTMGVPTNFKPWASGTIYFVQDATGSRTLGLNAAIKKFGAYTLSTAANAIDRCGYVYRGGVLELTALEKGLG